MTEFVDVATLRQWLADGGEIAFLDVREEGQHGAGHPLLAVNIPYSRLEAEIPHLVPRHSCRIALIDDADGIAGKAARRLEGLGYRDVQVMEAVRRHGRPRGISCFRAPTSRARVLPRSSSTSSPPR